MTGRDRYHLKWVILRSRARRNESIDEVYNSTLLLTQKMELSFILVRDDDDYVWYLQFAKSKDIYIPSTFSELSRELIYRRVERRYQLRIDTIQLFMARPDARCYPDEESFSMLVREPKKKSSLFTVSELIINGECSSALDVAAAGYKGEALQYGSQIRTLSQQVQLESENQSKKKIKWVPFNIESINGSGKAWRKVMLWLNKYIKKPQK